MSDSRIWDVYREDEDWIIHSLGQATFRKKPIETRELVDMYEDMRARLLCIKEMYENNLRWDCDGAWQAEPEMTWILEDL